jgi:hypothetical protein
VFVETAAGGAGPCLETARDCDATCLADWQPKQTNVAAPIATRPVKPIRLIAIRRWGDLLGCLRMKGPHYYRFNRHLRLAAYKRQERPAQTQLSLVRL